MNIDIKAIVEGEIDKNLAAKIEEGHIGDALDYLANSAQDPLQRKFLTHLSTHLKGLIDPDYKLPKDRKTEGKKREEEVKAKSNVGNDNIRESEAPAAYKKALDKTVQAIKDSKGSPRSFFDIFSNMFNGINDGDRDKDGVQDGPSDAGGRQARAAYATIDYDFVTEAKKAKKKKPVEQKPAVTPVIINPDKSEI